MGSLLAGELFGDVLMAGLGGQRRDLCCVCGAGDDDDDGDAWKCPGKKGHRRHYRHNSHCRHQGR